MATFHFQGEDGLRLSADAGGPLTGIPVVLLHGGGQTRFSWNRALEELVGEGFKVLAPDLRGHGESDWSPQGRYELNDYISDLGVVMKGLSAAPVLVGASLGGVISLIGQGEELLPPARALVMVDVVPRMEAEGVREILDFMSAHPAGFASLDAAADSVAQYLPGRERKSNSDGLLKNLRLRADGRYYWHWDPAINTVGSTAASREAMARRMEEAARHITIPTLVVRGARSRVVSAEGVAHLAQLIPHARYADVAEAGHMVAGDRNDLFNQVVHRFITEVTGS